MIKIKLPFREDVVRKENGKIIVDWKKIAEMERTYREGTYLGKLCTGTLHHLVDVGILSPEPKGNYGLMGCRVLLNPRVHILALYFTQREDAESYKEAMYSKAQYQVDIFQNQ